MSKPLIKLIILLLTMIFLSFIIGQVLTTIMPKKTVTEAIRLRNQAGIILNKLVSSKSCLAVEEGEKIIDSDVLESFQSRYPDTEPYCARSYYYGYYVKVETKTDGKEWYFGSRNHSEYDALKESVSLSIPIEIKMSESEVQSGIITIRMYRGELEELVGLIDKPCETGSKIDKNISLSYPVELSGSSLCMKAEKEFCRKITCVLYVEFDKIDSPGTYNFFSRREDFIVEVRNKKHQ